MRKQALYAFYDELQKVACTTDQRRTAPGGQARSATPTKESISGQLKSIRSLNAVGAPHMNLGANRAKYLSTL